MVVMKELKNSLWGLVLEGGSSTTEFKAERPVHITMASLNTAVESDEYVPVSVEISAASKFIVCTLSKKHSILQQAIDIELNTGESVAFVTNGARGCVNLMGYNLPDPQDLEQFHCDDENCDIDHSLEHGEEDSEEDHSDDDDDDDDEDGDDDEDDEDTDEDEDDEEEEDDEDEEDEESEEEEATNGKRKAITAPSGKDAKRAKEGQAPKLVPNEPAEKPAQKKASEPKTIYGGVTIQDLKEGHGPVAKKGKNIQVYYLGKLKNGKTFDSCLSGKPFRFKLGAGQVIKGWDIGFENMKVGGKRVIIVPPHMGYGSQRMGNDIPANSTLVFEVELKSVS